MPTRQIGATDFLVSAAATVALLIPGLSGNQPAGAQAWIGYFLLTLSGLALVALRRVPVLVLLVTGLCALGYLAVGFAMPALAFLVAVYGSVRAGRRMVAGVAAAVMLCTIPLVSLAMQAQSSVEAALTQSREILPLAWLLAAGLAGEALHQAVLRAEEAEHGREEAAERRADEERLRIARELHDALTHQISVIKIQTEAAVHLARKQGATVPDHLLAVRDAGREATRELRATLGALREDDQMPTGGLDDLDELVQMTRMAGVETSLTIVGDRVCVPSTVDRAGYRIVQEALTNIVRHAVATSVAVRVDYLPEAVFVRVADNGWAATNALPVPGIGLRGMRERVMALGGHIQAGRCSGGGFTVRAELPLDQAP